MPIASANFYIGYVRGVGKFKRRLAWELLEVIQHVGYVLDRTWTEQFMSGINH